MKYQSLALLMFNCNANDGIIRNVGLLKDKVDEILIVDSSNLNNYEELSNRFSDLSKLTIIRVFPTGHVEPLRVYALRKIRSEWVLYLDSDEEPNTSLVNALKNIDVKNTSAYNILRYEETLKCFVYHVRLYRRNSTSYTGTIHEKPKINGVIKKMHKDAYIIHHADLKTYLKSRNQYLEIEALEKPFTPFYLSSRSVIFSLFKDKYKILDKRLLLLLALFLLVKEIFSVSSIRFKSYRYSLFSFKYTLNKYNYLVRLPNKKELTRISADIAVHGGVIKYLNLDNVEYVENLNKSFAFDKNGITVFKELVYYRYRFHKSALSLTSPDFFKV